jgi:hypothetical protein
VKTETSPHPIIGYRKWGWDGERRRLTGPYTEIPWEPRTTIASCTEGHRHDAPDPGCECGLYADYRPPPPYEPSEFAAFVDELRRDRDLDFEDVVRLTVRRYRNADLARRLARSWAISGRYDLGEPWIATASGSQDCSPVLNRVYGAIALEGRVCVHASGLRGARARIVVLAYAPWEPPWERAPIEEIAALYGAEAVAYGELRQAALEFGIELSPRPCEPDPPPIERALPSCDPRPKPWRAWRNWKRGRYRRGCSG